MGAATGGGVGGGGYGTILTDTCIMSAYPTLSERTEIHDKHKMGSLRLRLLERQRFE